MNGRLLKIHSFIFKSKYSYVMERAIVMFKYTFFAVNPNLTNAIICTGEAYEDIAKIYDDQPRNDWEPLGDMMHDYKGTLAGWPGVLQIHAVSQVKKRPKEGASIISQSSEDFNT